METQPQQTYQQLLTAIIQQEMIILGSYFALLQARSVKGLSVADNGEITAISGNQEKITQQLIVKFNDISKSLSAKILQPILMEYPDPHEVPISGLNKP